MTEVVLRPSVCILCTGLILVPLPSTRNIHTIYNDTQIYRMMTWNNSSAAKKKKKQTVKADIIKSMGKK